MYLFSQVPSLKNTNTVSCFPLVRKKILKKINPTLLQHLVLQYSNHDSMFLLWLTKADRNGIKCPHIVHENIFKQW